MARFDLLVIESKDGVKFSCSLLGCVGFFIAVGAMFLAVKFAIWAWHTPFPWW